MGRDWKVGIVVILIILGVLVVVWGRGDRTADHSTDAGGPGSPITPPNNLGIDTSRAGVASGGGVTSRSPDAIRTAPITDLPLPPDSVIPKTDATKTDATTDTKQDATTKPVAAETTPAPKTWVYTVGKGDTIELIAEEQLGNRSRANEIIKLNNLSNPDRIFEGEKLKMPPKEAPAAGSGATTLPAGTSDSGSERARPRAAASSGPRYYVVKKGDTVMKIARDQLGHVSRCVDIVQMNDIEDPDSIEVGQRLILPPK